MIFPRVVFEDESIRLLGIIPAESTGIEFDEREGEYRKWIENGYHGTMAYLARHEQKKFRPPSILPGAESIVLCGLDYYIPGQRTHSADPVGIISRYAHGRDYHKELGYRLRRISRNLANVFPGDRFVPFTDATPLAERFFAQRAGLGFTGRHGLLITPGYGSWVFLGGVLSTRRFEPAPEVLSSLRCPVQCRRCISSCPTGALLGEGRIDARKCISYLTIEHDGVIPVALRARMGAWIFGCDECQDACPLNAGARVTQEPGFLRRIAGMEIPLAEVLRIPDTSAFVRRFAGSPLIRAGRNRLVRNACIAAANLHATALLPELKNLLRDSDEVVVETARWAIGELAPLV